MRRERAGIVKCAVAAFSEQTQSGLGKTVEAVDEPFRDVRVDSLPPKRLLHLLLGRVGGRPLPGLEPQRRDDGSEELWIFRGSIRPYHGRSSLSRRSHVTRAKAYRTRLMWREKRMRGCFLRSVRAFHSPREITHNYGNERVRFELVLEI